MIRFLFSAIFGIAASAESAEEPEAAEVKDLHITPLQTAIAIGGVTFLFGIRVYAAAAAKKASKQKPQHALKLRRLNTVVMFKEIVLAYLNAALLDPIIAISNLSLNQTVALFVNAAMFLCIFWWIFLITDAFDTSDTEMEFKYQSFKEEVKKDPKKYEWLKLGPEAKGDEEAEEFVGSMQRDVALWFLLICIGAAFTGVVSHIDVMHAWAIVILWACLHHLIRQSTVWGASYPVTLFLPSAALLPLEFCIPLQEIEDVDAMTEWRTYILKRCGVNLMIDSYST
eukprot:gnl/TRDRNA2_/TRDRNA2_188451_c0_seq1.p1 gnl/TRDRNA2_/TRDRNA2_188451_c0~~gnl/TRDRNA2_/TRDRNA2_188451_c0_seq1.p1  ORF type:complete len:284 (+),score=58.32 gnl/TRDRNA2_/TRDRNA2_188451_c0_seq1:71-922(+)